MAATNPIRGLCVDDNLQLIEHGKKRVGRPRNNWWIAGITALWCKIRNKQGNEQYRWTALDLNDSAHRRLLKDSAQHMRLQRGGIGEV